MKECAPPPPDGIGLDPLKSGALREATVMAGVAPLELGRAAGTRLIDVCSQTEVLK